MTRAQVWLFLQSQALIWLPLLAGTLATRRGWLRPERARPLHSLNLFLISPVVTTLGMWYLNRSMPGWYWPPLLMSAMLAISTGLAAWLGPRAVSTPAQAGTLIVMAPLSNVGHTLAGFLTILLLSEQAYPYNAIGGLPQVFFVFGVWLPLARHWSRGGDRPFWHTLREGLWSIQSLPLAGLALGAWLNVAGPPIGGAWVALMKWLVFIGTAFTMFALGMRMQFRREPGHTRPLRLVYLFKFVLHPLIAVALCLATGVRGMPAGALLIISFMPVGVYAVALASLYELDIELANEGYLWSTLYFMALVLPVLIVMLQLPYFRLP